MGIQGLLPYLKKIHTPVNVGQFHGSTVAVDAYCWLHKGAFSCAEKLALGEKTEQYVYYCMKYIEYMQKQDLKVIMVFDGCHLQSKAGVEKSRRERRESNRKKAAQFLREGRRSEAKECLQRCVDITPQMALDLMNACRARGVDCIVAPYEADAQLAFLSNSGIAQVIVTEDSDLLLFGCEKIIFKMDFHGNGTLIEKSRLNEVISVQTDFYTFDKFRFMCILSGCDYMPSISGIGLAKANKVFKIARQGDIRQLLKKLPTYLKMNVVVSDEYVDGFFRANNTFLYQLIFDPLTRCLKPLNPLPSELNGVNLDYAGKNLSQDLAYQIALGNIDIHTKEIIGHFDPDKLNTHRGPVNARSCRLLSIWNKKYRPGAAGSPCKAIQTAETINNNNQRVRASGVEKDKVISTEGLKKMLAKLDKEFEKPVLTNKEVASFYACEDDVDEEEQIKRARKNLMESSDGFSSFDDLGDNEVTADEANEQENVTSSVSSSDENDSCNQQHTHFDTGRHKFQYTAANIGEETFKRDSDEGAKENKESPRKNKPRNIFAVSKSHIRKKAERSTDVEVKSWYFSSSKQPSSSIVTNSSPIKTVSETKSVFSPSSKMRVKSESASLSIRFMFEKASERNKRVKDDTCDENNCSEGNITEEKALQSPLNQDMQSSRTVDNESESLMLDKLIQKQEVEESEEKPNRLRNKHCGSVKNKGKTNALSKLSAFSWSKLNSANKIRNSNDKDDRIGASKEKNFSKTHSREDLSRDIIGKISETKRKCSIDSSDSLVEPPAKMNKTSPTTSSYFTKPEPTRDSLSQSDDSDSLQDVQELEYQSYEGFLKSVSGDSPSYTKLLEEPKASKKASDCQLSNSLVEGPCVQNTADDSKSKCFKIETLGVIDLTKECQTTVKPACRVSGLSKKKGKQKSMDSQQPKIQNFFSKYSFEKKVMNADIDMKTPQVRSDTSEQNLSQDSEEDEDDLNICTPVTTVPLPNGIHVKRKLSL